MTWKHLYFGFDGRIGRRQWWTAMLPLLLASMAVSFIANPMAWFSVAVAMRGPNLAETLFDLAFLIPETAITVKRFNDRNRPQWLAYAYAAIFLLFILLNHKRVILASHAPTLFELGFVSSLVAVMVIIVIDNGFLRGTIGPNRYGPDPLAQDSEDAVITSSGDERP